MPSHAAGTGPVPETAPGVDERRILLDIARRAVEAAARGTAAPSVDDTLLPEALRALHGAFVTLTKFGELRGCIGTLDFASPLWASVLGAARSAALDDPRFPPLEVAELADIRLEISILDPPVELADPATFTPATQGIIVERGWARGLLLPQVAAERGWDGPTTLRAACLKAGLSPGAWQDPGTRLAVFDSVHFGDDAGPEPTGDQSGSVGTASG